MNANIGLSKWGWTLAEVLVAMAISSIMVGGLVVTSYAVQRSFRASQHHVNAQAQQMRLLDYINLDLRRALTVSTASERLTVTIPDFYDPDGYPRDPEIYAGTATYGTTPVTISYYREGDAICRQVGTNKQVLATEVSDFQFAFQDLGQSIVVSFTFVPRFQLDGSVDEGVRSNTATFSSTLLRNKRQY